MNDGQNEDPPALPFLRFEEIVGRGGMSVVWRAWHLELRRYVAVKVMDRRFTASRQDLRQFKAEVRAMTDIHHPGIVQGYGADCTDGRYYMIMDYVDGYTFGALIARKTKIPEIDALIICESVAEAMHYAWERHGVVHCDIKPENIMADRDGTVKLLDLGLCHTSNAFGPGDNPDEVVGTPAYISPEQVLGVADIDCRADIYSLGATLYHLCTGRTLFPLMSNDDILRAHVDSKSRAPDPRRIVPALSQGFARLVARMLVKDRDLRPRTWIDVYNAAKAVEDGASLQPLPQGCASSSSLDD